VEPAAAPERHPGLTHAPRTRSQSVTHFSHPRQRGSNPETAHLHGIAAGRQFPSSSGIQNGLVDIGVECAPGTFTPHTIAFGSSSNIISGCYGALNFGIGGYNHFSPSNNAGNVGAFQGPVTGDSTLPGQWVTYGTGLPSGWTGHVSLRFLPTGNEVMVSWAFDVAPGTAVHSGMVVATVASGFQYSDNKVLSGNIAGATFTGNQYAPGSVTPAGTFQYNGPAFNSTSTGWWYGQGIYTLSVA
jgi:hypothetical protein